SQQCQEPIPIATVDILETQQTGDIIYVMDTSPKRTTWTMQILNLEFLLNSMNLQNYFRLSRVNSTSMYWQLRLHKSLDTEEIYKLINVLVSYIDLVLECVDSVSFTSFTYTRRINVIHVSEFMPVFQPNITVYINETWEVGKPVVDLKQYVTDGDVSDVDGDIKLCVQNVYMGAGKSGFDIIVPNADCQILLENKVDFENQVHQYFINVTVQDSGGLASFTIITIYIENMDEGPPYLACDKSCSGCGTGDYAAFITPLTTGVIREMIPNQLKAFDPDLADVHYKIIASSPPVSSTFVLLNETTGELNIVKPFKALPVSLVVFQVQISNKPLLLKPGVMKTTQHKLASLALVIVSQESLTSEDSVPASTKRINNVLFVGSSVVLSALLGSILACLGIMIQMKQSKSTLGKIDDLEKSFDQVN
ncbi:hypothetical protein Btru_064506, partial [Bulinus truncatus]